MIRRLIRTRWGALATIAVIAGGVCVYMSSVWRGDSWLSGVLVNVGTGLVLFLPLLLIGWGVERRLDDVRKRQDVAAERQAQIEERQAEVTSDVARLEGEITKTQDDLRLTREELSDAVVARLAAKRSEDSKIFSAVGVDPKQEEMFAAINRASKLGIVAPVGPRVYVPGGDVYVRFATDQEEYGAGVIVLFVETPSGESKEELGWYPGESATDLLVSLGELLQSIGRYPGDKSFGSLRLFSDLHDLLDIGHQWSINGKVALHELAPLVQFCPPQWVVTMSGITSLDPAGYTIPVSRFDEDWESHMGGKPWVDQDSLQEALAAGRALFHAYRLASHPRSPWDSEVPF
ncbi:hypothetical protein GCM10017600_38410 [Streptosporangium carneum]|uniref:Uncharacterized protein n=2 Tax=Streptosporangium carneum TaxID=47481 RepID=A0A9W6MDZ4_9ACTN|nr:hypothetical protein GCM10017600_38410 [Streptosporangium carneum]